jgi:putative lipoprotein
MISKRVLPVALLAVAGAFAVVPATAVAGDAAAAGKVTGFVSYENNDDLSPTAVLTVKLVDISRADAPADVVAQQVIQTSGLQVPIAYEVDYDPAKIDPSHRYAIQARIDDQGSLQYTSDRVYPVLTQGAKDTVSIELTQVPQD